MPKGIPNKRYTPEFKVMVVETMRKENLSYSETARKYKVSSKTQIVSWERILPSFICSGRRSICHQFLTYVAAML